MIFFKVMKCGFISLAAFTCAFFLQQFCHEICKTANLRAKTVNLYLSLPRVAPVAINIFPLRGNPCYWRFFQFFRGRVLPITELCNRFLVAINIFFLSGNPCYLRFFRFLRGGGLSMTELCNRFLVITLCFVAKFAKHSKFACQNYCHTLNFATGYAAFYSFLKTFEVTGVSIFNYNFYGNFVVPSLFTNFERATE